MPNQLDGIVYLLIANTAYAVVALVLVLAYGKGIEIACAIMVPASIEAVIAALWCGFTRTNIIPSRAERRKCAVVSYFAAIAYVLQRVAYSYGEYGNNVAISALSPLIAAPLAYCLLQEEVLPVFWIFSAFAFFGVILIVQPSFLFGASNGYEYAWVGYCIMALGTVFMALVYVHQSMYNIPGAVLAFWTRFSLSLGAIAYCFFFDVDISVDYVGWMFLVAIAFLDVFAFSMEMNGAALAGPTKTALMQLVGTPISYILQILFLTYLGADGFVYTGVVFVLASVACYLYITREPDLVDREETTTSVREIQEILLRNGNVVPGVPARQPEEVGAA